MIELTPESRDEVVVEEMEILIDALEDGKPRMDDLLIISAAKRILNYFTVQE